MNLIDKIRRTRSDTLKNSDILGCYDFYTAIVSLDSCNENDFTNVREIEEKYHKAMKGELSINLDDYKILSKFHSVYYHEITHFIDSTSSLWGFKYLNMMSKAYTADNLRFKSTENDFYNAKIFSEFLRFSRLPAYFTEIGNANSSQPWYKTITTGKRFTSDGRVSDIPIIFTRFISEDRKLIARSPISDISVLECSAMSQEIQFNLNVISLLGDENPVQLEIYKQSIVSYMYNKNITEYSVIFHLLSDKIQEDSPMDVFIISSLLCKYLLNFPNELYDKIHDQFDFNNLYNGDLRYSTERNEIKKGIKNKNIGFLFYLIYFFIEKNLNLENFNIKFRECLTHLGLSYQEFIDKSNQEAGELFELLKSSKIKEIVTLAESGYDNFTKIDYDNPLLDFDKLNLPFVLLGDCEKINVYPSNTGNKLINLDLDDLYNELLKGQQWVERFTEAC